MHGRTSVVEHVRSPTLMDIYSLLQANCDRLLEQYETNLRDVRMLQETMINDILPSVVDELSLGKDEIKWAKSWLKDTRKAVLLLDAFLVLQPA